LRWKTVCVLQSVKAAVLLVRVLLPRLLSNSCSE
jgi:hypothetical protein